MDDGAVAHYQGLLLSLTHRFSHNFQLNANFTDSYCLSDYDFGAALATLDQLATLSIAMPTGVPAFPTRATTSIFPAWR